MDVKSVGSNPFSAQQVLSFKSAYPVYYWVTANDKQYGIAMTETLAKKLQRKLVGILNGTKNPKNAENKAVFDKVKNKISSKDSSYKSMGIVRSYYNKKGGFKENKHFEPITYLITGSDAEMFDGLFGKPLGRFKHSSKMANNKSQSAELIVAQDDYKTYGLSWVKNISRQFRDENNSLLGLHTKFKIIRNKNGKIKDFQLIDVKFCPETGKENPFVRCGYYQSAN